MDVKEAKNDNHLRRLHWMSYQTNLQLGYTIHSSDGGSLGSKIFSTSSSLPSTENVLETLACVKRYGDVGISYDMILEYQQNVLFRNKAVSIVILECV